MQRRSARIRLSAEAAAGRTLIVELKSPRAGGAVSGSITVIEPDGSSSARRLEAKGCDEAMAGLSLIATVTLDPEALLGEPAEPEPEAEPVVAPEALQSPPPPAPPSPPAAAVPEPPSFRLSAGLQGAVLLHAAPEPALGGAVFAALELRAGRVLSPLWRVSVMHVQSRGVSQAAGDANFAFTVPTLDGCPLRLGPRALGVRPCAYVGLGVLKVWGENTAQQETHLRPSGSAGAAVQLSAQVSEVFEIVADARGGAALFRDSFAFDRASFFRTRPLLFSAAIGVAGGFP